MRLQILRPDVLCRHLRASEIGIRMAMGSERAGILQRNLAGNEFAKHLLGKHLPSIESCMGIRAAYVHTTTTKREEDRSGDSRAVRRFAIIRRTSDWL